MRRRPRGRRARPTNSISIDSDGISPAAPKAPEAIVQPAFPAIAADGSTSPAEGAKTASVETVTCPTPSVAETVIVWFPSIPVRSHS